jgi:hypothetical protein
MESLTEIGLTIPFKIILTFLQALIRKTFRTKLFILGIWYLRLITASPCWRLFAEATKVFQPTFLILKKIKVRLYDLHPVYVSVYPFCQVLNVWTNLYKTWNLYHRIWAHFNGVFYKYLPSVRVSICVSTASVARQQLGIHGPAPTNKKLRGL